MDVYLEHLVDSIHEGTLEAVRGGCCQDYFLVLLYAAPHLYHLFTSEFVDILGRALHFRQHLFTQVFFQIVLSEYFLLKFLEFFLPWVNKGYFDFPRTIGLLFKVPDSGLVE